MSHLSKPPLKSILIHSNQPTEQMQSPRGFFEEGILTDETSVKDPRINKAIELLRSNLHLPLSLAATAKIVNLSESRLRRLFSEVTGLPLAHFVKLLRLEAARHLLATEFLTVKEVLAKTGIKDPSHFNRDFKTAFGVPPSRYRHQSKVSNDQVSPDPRQHSIRQTL